jgi:CheY-like chemotaxis protein
MVEGRSILNGLRILIVEDEAMIAMLIEDMLSDLGCVPVGPANTAERALHLIQSERFDGAILDVNLGGQHTARRRGS